MLSIECYCPNKINFKISVKELYPYYFITLYDAAGMSTSYQLPATSYQLPATVFDDMIVKYMLFWLLTVLDEAPLDDTAGI